MGRRFSIHQLAAAGKHEEEHQPEQGDAGSHLELELGHGPAAVRSMAFGSGHRAEDLRVGQVVDVLFVPRINRFRGRNTVEMELVVTKAST